MEWDDWQYFFPVVRMKVLFCLNLPTTQTVHSFDLVSAAYVCNILSLKNERQLLRPKQIIKEEIAYDGSYGNGQ